MTNQSISLFHLTNVSKCVDILREKKLRPHLLEKDFNLQRLSYFTSERLLSDFNPENFVHFSFCPRSVMLFKVKQGEKVSHTSFYGQQDAVHIQIPNFYELCIQMDMEMTEYSNSMSKTIVLSNMDCSLFYERRVTLLDPNLTEKCLMENLDKGVLEKEYAWQPNEIRAKSVELLIAPYVNLSLIRNCVVGVYNGYIKGNLEDKLKNEKIDATGVKIEAYPKWYF